MCLPLWDRQGGLAGGRRNHPGPQTWGGSPGPAVIQARICPSLCAWALRPNSKLCPIKDSALGNVFHIPTSFSPGKALPHEADLQMQ